MRPSNPCFNKLSRWFWWTLKFENQWSSPESPRCPPPNHSAPPFSDLLLIWSLSSSNRLHDPDFDLCCLPFVLGFRAGGAGGSRHYSKPFSFCSPPSSSIITSFVAEFFTITDTLSFYITEFSTITKASRHTYKHVSQNLRKSHVDSRLNTSDANDASIFTFKLDCSHEL